MEETLNEAIIQQLNALFKTRYHGAINIRGIRYQLLYSVFRVFDLYKIDAATAIQLEGIEDLDLLGLSVGDEHVQVKTANEPWSWSQLKEPLQGFLETSRIDSQKHFVLAVNFPLLRDIAKLAQWAFLEQHEKKAIEKKFVILCRKLGASTREANNLLSRLSIITLSEEKLLSEISLAITRVFDIGSEASAIYILVLVAKFLEWAQERKRVTRSDLEDLRDILGENLAKESIYQAYGRGLVKQIEWGRDGEYLDFFEGKGRTRPSHIAANLDVRRPHWLERIDQALQSSRICILRSSSGQGKSVLLYRYAHDHWPEHAVFVLRVAESQEHVEQICDYLRFKARLGVPLLLLVDNVGWQTPLWAYVAQECIALGISVMATVRHEDWHRYPFGNWETLEPTLDLDEAREIFAAFRTEGRLHPSIDAPEWAYEKIGEPHLLMEFVYFLTHGQMLEERLRSQLQHFSWQREDPAKFEIIRRVALADALRCPVNIHTCLQNISLTDDPQRVLLSLSEEYVRLEGKYMTGLHWVRSDHLIRILHEGYPNMVSTALLLIDAIPSSYIPTLVANALSRKEIDRDIFLTGLLKKGKSAGISVVLAFLTGLFEAGERQFFDENRGTFQEIYNDGGPLLLFLLSMDTMPIIRANLLTLMENLLKEDRAGNIQRLQAIKAKMKDGRRGLDFCRDFLKNMDKSIDAEAFTAHLEATGILLDWYALCGCTFSAWPAVRDKLLTEIAWFDMSLDVFCHLAQGFYRYDNTSYRQWFSYHREDILGYLQLQIGCIELTLTENELSIEFFPDQDVSNANEQAVSRLRRLKSALPFCERYLAQGIWIMPFHLPKPSVDDTYKNMPTKNLPFVSDVLKNEVWRKCVESQYLPDSYYRYEEAWYRLRSTALLFVQRFSEGVQSILTGRDFDVQTAFEQGKLLTRVEHTINFIPRTLSKDEAESIGETLPQPLKLFATEEVLSKWSSTFGNFFHQIFEFLADQKKKRATGELATYNFSNVLEHLPELHQAFSSLFLHAPDYFHVNELNQDELIAYQHLADLLEVWILEPPQTPQRDILGYIKAKKQKKQKELTSCLSEVADRLKLQDIDLLYPSRIHTLYPFASPVRYLPCAFFIRDLFSLESDLSTVIITMAKEKSLADVFYFIPLYRGMRFLDGGYHFNSNQMQEIAQGQLGQLESLVLHTIPSSVLSELPPVPFQIPEQLQVQAGVVALLGALQVCSDKADRLSMLGNSHNRFQRELHTKEFAKLEKIGSTIGHTALHLSTLLVSAFPVEEGTTAYELIKDFLEFVAQAGQQNADKTSLNSFTFHPSDIVKALEILMHH